MESQSNGLTEIATSMREQISSGRAQRMGGRVADLLGEFGLERLDEDSVESVNYALGSAGLACSPRLDTKLKLKTRVTVSLPGGRSIEQVFRDCSPARLYAATTRTVAEMGYAIVNSDSTSMTISFRTGMSMKSWQGQEMTATVVAEGTTASKILIGGRRATHGAVLQVFDWGEARSIAYTLLDRLSPILASTPEPVQTLAPAAAPQVSTADELERIAKLHQQGLLTPEEFAEAKRKLLG